MRNKLLIGVLMCSFILPFAMAQEPSAPSSFGFGFELGLGTETLPIDPTAPVDPTAPADVTNQATYQKLA
ncbi:MAG TPA: hypothetical protein PLB48_00610, partial [Treponema sp.]|nr:hypothetical protein [Treponema sp.]